MCGIPHPRSHPLLLPFRDRPSWNQPTFIEFVVAYAHSKSIDTSTLIHTNTNTTTNAITTPNMPTTIHTSMSKKKSKNNSTDKVS